MESGINIRGFPIKWTFLLVFKLINSKIHTVRYYLNLVLALKTTFLNLWHHFTKVLTQKLSVHTDLRS